MRTCNTAHTRVPIVQVVLFAGVLAASALVGACGTSASDMEGDTTGTTSARPAAAPVSRGREVTLPTGTVLALSLGSSVASDTSRVEDAVTAELTSAVVVDGRTVLPAGAMVAGIVSGVEESGRVKGRASLALDFTSLTTGGVRYPLSARAVSRLAPATKGEDATKIGIGAGAGAIIGGIFGGKKGAAQGAAVGGGAGTGVVLATRGQEVRLQSGSDVSTELSAPLTLRIRN